MYSRPIGQSLHPGLYLEASNAETLLGAVAENPFTAYQTLIQKLCGLFNTWWFHW